ncbi:ATP-grasp domain-containing protein [Hydrocarboniclastica marina]|uniref:ATP-grasp domain-containing protein n=1 Tax=Hydrocarboniclastica marina TaxID=2259620 RepID=A0A4P7XI37_9ALTE|nr:ATP-grasp domain-containing protein [Hydrocarboniclastica marina]MAL97119.1 hypothetical protein [Alteromonadaceae bacterium]QCF25527.1 ATP-grasp domain-containing protein [Hydrocarboniclastica marina]|tara:strand:- start:1646 stop:2884 length:1239 start_codon:yes stop_codon:yes gene_type:complete
MADSLVRKTLLIIGAGIEGVEGIKVAHAMGLRLVVADGNPQAPGFAWADHTLVLSTYDADGLAAAAIQLRDEGTVIDGVIAMCADVPVSVAKIKEALGLPGLSLESAHWVADKLLMKQRLKACGIPIPGFAAVSSVADMHVASAKLGLPMVIKPVDSRGARGVLLLDMEEQFPEAFRLAQKESPTGRVMVEEYLTGQQISTETLIDDGHCFTLGFSDRNYEWLERTRPYMIENGGDAPSALTEDEQRNVIETVERAALALNIHSGVAKGDMVLTPDGAKVIEIAGRLSGGYFSTTQIPLATGVNFVEQAILLALGFHLDPLTVTPKKWRAVAIRYLDLPAGTIAAISGESEARNQPGIEMLSLFFHPGDRLQALANHTQRAGFAIATGDNKTQAIARAQGALARIRVSYVEE